MHGLQFSSFGLVVRQQGVVGLLEHLAARYNRSGDKIVLYTMNSISAVLHVQMVVHVAGNMLLLSIRPRRIETPRAGIWGDPWGECWTCPSLWRPQIR